MLRFKAIYVIHAAGWLLFLIFPLLFLNDGLKGKGAVTLLSSSYYLLFCLTYMVMFYFNLGYLIPQFLLRKRYLVYSLIVVFLFSCVYFLQPFDKLLAHNPRVEAQMAAQARQRYVDSVNESHRFFGPLPHENLRMQDPMSKQSAGISPLLAHSRNIDTISLIIFALMMALSVAIGTVQQWQTTEQKVIKAEAEKANAELSFLKAQINPHFLFNTLNNIYTLSITDSEHTSESIMKLSNIMRYVTDEVSQDLVSLQDEVNCLNDYIDLQRLRLGKKTHVQFDIKGSITNQKIAPLILIPFIENMFKYGISKAKESTLKIELIAEAQTITLLCENPVFADQPKNTERTGVGIANTKQRLGYMYPGKHLLSIEEKNDLFRVKLTLHC
ncbi:sensor histidine kinase [Mucilaginibacter myungsuensis]|uniref:Histidine kinase n=1 Tax=Mucilaginibacter myungsuensis TaxID=649104 RepID=A0A929KXZ3_9SPHI|nr:histidine kinase [Mucilaginibacter myungsuensis]MBE9660959.1 histidine kinase [Mucilaginibacter myungsuensis]MDN3601005.1 histidine kinase [Mucilaginibacter myungsuensis]